MIHIVYVHVCIRSVRAGLCGEHTWSCTLSSCCSLHAQMVWMITSIRIACNHTQQDIGFTETEDIGVSLQTYIFTCTGRSVAAFDLSTICEGWNVFNILYDRDDAPPPRPRPRPRRRCSTAAPTTRKWPPCSCHAGTWRVVSEKIGSMRRESRGKVDKA